MPALSKKTEDSLGSFAPFKKANKHLQLLRLQKRWRSEETDVKKFASTKTQAHEKKSYRRTAKPQISFQKCKNVFGMRRKSKGKKESDRLYSDTKKHGVKFYAKKELVESFEAKKVMID